MTRQEDGRLVMDGGFRTAVIEDVGESVNTGVAGQISVVGHGKATADTLRLMAALSEGRAGLQYVVVRRIQALV